MYQGKSLYPGIEVSLWAIVLKLADTHNYVLFIIMHCILVLVLDE